MKKKKRKTQTTFRTAFFRKLKSKTEQEFLDRMKFVLCLIESMSGFLLCMVT